MALVPTWLRALRAYCHRMPYNRGKFRLVARAYRQFCIPDLETLSNLDSVGIVKLRLRIWVDFNIYCIGLYEHYLARFFINQVQRDSIVFDVGAYIGQYTLLAAHYAPAGFAYGFEPLQDSANRFRDSIRHIGLTNCEVIGEAVGDIRGSVPFFVAPQSFTSSTIASHTRATDAINVPITTIDAFCADRNIDKVDILKVDVEEAEDFVIAGAIQTLDRHHPLILMEVGRVTSLQTPTPALALLGGLGYRFFRMNHGHLEPIKSRIEAAENVVAMTAK